MKKALRKDFFMDIRKSFARFISIFLIVALGVAFFSGIQAASPDMRYSGDAYYDETMLMDIRVMGSYGLTDEDLEALNAVKGVELAEGGYAMDVLSGEEGEQRVIHLESLGGRLNQISVEEGRLPEKAGECLIDSEMADKGLYQVDDKIEFYTEEEDSILQQKSFTIVGTCSSPLYISFSRGNTTLGSGEVAGFAYVTEDNFTQEAYTVAYLLAKGSRKQTSYTDLYDNLVEKVKKRVEGIEEERCQARYLSIQEEAEQELADARQELEDGRQESQEELDKARAELDDNKQELADARAEYLDGQRELETGRQELADARIQLSDAKTQYQDGMTQLEAAQAEIDSQQTQLEQSQAETTQGYVSWNSAKEELDQKEAEYDSGKAQYDQSAEALAQAQQQLEQQKEAYGQAAAAGMADAQTQAQLDATEAQLSSQEATLAQTKEQLDAAKTQLDSGRQELESNQAALDSAQAQIDSSSDQLASAQEQLSQKAASLDAAAQEISDNEAELEQSEQEIEDNQQKLDDAAAQLDENEKKLEDGENEYNTAKKEAEDAIAEAEEKLADAQEEANSLEIPKWYIDDRSSLPEYSDYGDNADRIRNIGRVFPVLFFLVAALISLTTMTRMVEDQRTQIGTLKALGYTKRAIAGKYLGYALLATLGGSVLGILVGEKILPYIIITAYGIMYHHMSAQIEIPYQMHYALIGSATAVCCTLAATFSACARELKETPASLMRPASPREGKRVLLEHIPFLWKHLSFTWKSTIRNLFRYKKRFFMTIVGISGCTALMLVGFGLQDSIMDIGSLQYGQLQHYDATVIQDEDASEDEKARLSEFLATDGRIQESIHVYFQKMTASRAEEQRDIYVIVPEQTEGFSELVTMRDRQSKEEYRLEDAGAVISEKTAKLLEATVGDTIDLQVEDGISGQVKIGAICENYMSHYLYLSPQAFQEAFGETAEYSDSLVIFQKEYQDNPEEVGRDIMNYPAALSISYTGSIASQLENMLSSLDAVILVLIISAGMLAFVVLYNLNNINISERERELATLKVLGFFDGEVSAYVFRENVLLTLIGAAMGAGLGIPLHRFVIVTVEVDAAMFGRNIYPPSFIYSILFTIGFSAVVNIVMHFKLKQIDMVESLKSVE